MILLPDAITFLITPFLSKTPTMPLAQEYLIKKEREITYMYFDKKLS